MTRTLTVESLRSHPHQSTGSHSSPQDDITPCFMNASRVQVTRPRKAPDTVRSIKDSDTPQHHGNQPSHSKPLARHLCRQSDSSAPIVSLVPVVTIYLWGLLYQRLKPHLGGQKILGPHPCCGLSVFGRMDDKEKDAIWCHVKGPFSLDPCCTVQP